MAATRDGAPQVADDQVAARLGQVRDRVAAAARAAGRDPGTVRLVAVSKFHPPAAIAAAYAAGQVDFGESRAQELVAKRDAVAAPVRWHFVGRLQRNKAKQVVGQVALIHSVDRVRLAEAVAAQAVRRDAAQAVLVQVNVAGEERKGGCPPDAVPALLERIDELDGVHATGLMAIPPITADPAEMFKTMRALHARLLPAFPGLRELSMGMSADLEAAIAHGATIVRVGTAIFGARPRDQVK